MGDRHPEMQGGRGKATRNVQTTTKDVPTAKSGTGERERERERERESYMHHDITYRPSV